MDAEKRKIEVRHVPERQQFEAGLEGETAYLSYTTHGDRISLDHTYVPDSWRGRGVAGELTRAAVEEARRRQWKLRAECSYVVAFFARHPEFADVVEATATD